MQLPAEVIPYLEQLALERFPPEVDGRLQELMDRNNFGELDEVEKAELTEWVELSQELSLVRGRALLLLKRDANTFERVRSLLLNQPGA